MQVEVFGLFGQQALGLVGQVFAALNRFFARQVKTRLARQAHARYPASAACLRSERLQRLANVGLAIGVHIEIRAQFIHQRGEVLQLVVKTLARAPDLPRLVRLLIVSACSLRNLV